MDCTPVTGLYNKLRCWDSGSPIAKVMKLAVTEVGLYAHKTTRFCRATSCSHTRDPPTCRILLSNHIKTSSRHFCMLLHNQQHYLDVEAPPLSVWLRGVALRHILLLPVFLGVGGVRSSSGSGWSSHPRPNSGAHNTPLASIRPLHSLLWCLGVHYLQQKCLW